MGGKSLKGITLSFMKQNQWWVWLTFVCVMISFPIELILLSYISGKIFTSMSDMKKKKQSARIVRLVLLFVLVYFILETTIIIRDRCDASFIPDLDREIRNEVIQSIIHKNEIQYDNIIMGEMVVRFLKMPSNSFYSYGILTKFIIPFVAAIVFIGIYVAYLNYRVGLLYIILFSVYLCIFYFLCRIMIRATKERVRAEMRVFNDIEDTMTNIQSIYSANMVDEEKTRLDKEQKAYNKLYTKNLVIGARMKIIMSVFSVIVVISIFLFCMYLFRRGRMKQETLVSLVVLFVFMTRFMGYTCRRIIEGTITIGSMMEDDQFIDSFESARVPDGNGVGFIHEGEIRFDHVRFGFHKNDPLFDGFSLVIPARSALLLVGDSGSGKTTFLRLLMGFFSLDTGRILIDGHDIAGSKRSYLRSHISYINQTTRLFDRPIMENILYGCKGKTPDDVKRFMTENGLNDMFRHFSLDDSAGRSGDKLSGGMRQIVLLMRCYFRDCPIVIIDEATSNIDARNRKHALRIIQQMMKGKTVIAVSHDKDIAGLFSRRLVFSNGRIYTES